MTAPVREDGGGFCALVCEKGFLWGELRLTKKFLAPPLGELSAKLTEGAFAPQRPFRHGCAVPPPPEGEARACISALRFVIINKRKPLKLFEFFLYTKGKLCYSNGA